MSLQIDLFKSAVVSSKVNQYYALAVKKNLGRPERFFFQNARRMELYDTYKEIWDKNKDNRYTTLRDMTYDKFLELEKIGATSVSFERTLYIDFRDCLDIVLDHLTGTPGHITRQMKDYLAISYGLLDAGLRDIGTNAEFVDLITSEKIETYLKQEGYDEDPLGFIKDIMTTAEDILRYIATHIVVNVGDGTTIRSVRPAEVVIASKKEFGDITVLVNGREYLLLTENMRAVERIGETDVSWLLRELTR